VLNVWVRNLHDGSTAIIFINNGPGPVHMQCNAACIARARLTPGQYTARDLYTCKDASGVTVGKDGFSVGLVPGDAGSLLWKLTPASAL
jgi:hypothetical protein